MKHAPMKHAASPGHPATERAARRPGVLKRRLAILWLAVAALGLLASGSYAAYTSIYSAKRVVSTQESAELLFSSNYLVAYPLCDPPADVLCDTKPVSLSAASPTLVISVCNYDQLHPAKANEKTIAYTFEAVLVDRDGVPLADGGKLPQDAAGATIPLETLERLYTLTRISDGAAATFSGGTASLDGELEANVPTHDRYTLTLAQSLLDDVSVKLCAYPADAASQSATEHFMLARVLSASATTTQTVTDWVGRFTDSAPASQDLDGFNYELSGAQGGTVTLQWNTDYLQLSPWFLEDLAQNGRLIAPADSAQAASLGSITFSVLASDALYQLQFYRAAPASASETWSSVNDWVTCTFVASTQGG